jgi:hypothetical protein
LLASLTALSEQNLVSEAAPFAEEDADMTKFVSRMFAVVLLAAGLGLTLVAVGPGSARAVEVGEPAPPFSLAATTGGDISLNDFRGKKWVLVEFYGADFAPT